MESLSGMVKPHRSSSLILTMFHAMPFLLRSAFEEFLGELLVGNGTCSTPVVFEDGQAVAGSLSNPDGSGDDCLVELLGEVVLNFFYNLLREIGPAIIHRHEDAFEYRRRANSCFPDMFDDVDNFGESFEAKPFTLQWDDDFVGSSEGRSHKDTEGRRGIEDDIIIVVCFFQFDQELAKAGEVVGHLCELDFDPGEVHVAGHEGKVFDPGGDDVVLESRLADERKIHASLGSGFLAESTGGIGLGIEVQEEDFFASIGQCSGKIDRGGGLSNSSFLVGDSDNLHRNLLGRKVAREWCERKKKGGEDERFSATQFAGLFGGCFDRFDGG